MVTIDHIGIVVDDMSRALEVFENGLGLKLKEQTNYPKLGMKVVILEAQNISLELIEPVGPGPYWNGGKPHPHYNHLAVDMRTLVSANRRFAKSGLSILPGKRKTRNGGYLQILDSKTTMGLAVQLIRKGK